jgi:thiol-disulfide isomerase/thioredoxin
MIVAAIFCFLSAGLVVLGNDPLAKTDSDSNKLDRLMADLGVSAHPFSTDPRMIKLQNTAGRDVRLDDFQGKIVFLNFWATWCPTCRTEMPSMERLHRKLSGKDFAIVTVNIKETASQVKNFFEEHKLTFTALLDTTGGVSAEFGIGAIPTTFILDKGGQILGRISGAREWDSKESVALFENLADN